FFHIDIAEVRTEEGKLHLFVAIDRTSKFAFVELHEKARTKIPPDFLPHLIAAVPYKIHTVLTDNGIQSRRRVPVARPSSRSRRPSPEANSSAPMPLNSPARKTISTLG